MNDLSTRQTDIVAMARDVGRVEVDDLARRLDVTPQTIRKDLNELCDRKILVRIHGGATIGSSVENMSYEARRFVATSEKQRIGQAAARLIPSRSSLFINIGTTTEEVAAALATHEHILVITNNLNVAMALHRKPTFEVIIAGGTVRPTDGGVVGAQAVDLIGQFKVDVAVIGVSAIDADGTLLDFDHREVRVAQAIIKNARHVMLVADRTKVQRLAPVRIAHLSQIHTFVTDYLTSEPLRQLCSSLRIQLIETDAAPESSAADINQAIGLHDVD
ncbi:DeoR/GlpR family DNA-binding transcription regulator [Rhizobium sp. 2YAF20]|uniref:DeoR/GlpR family DNA-binding transcription regulator n=1 Tax=Rhizobium sp. 2YAF20 TaxID=3233027 RepID=UPI003F99A262